MGWGTIIVFALIFGAITAAIGQKKNLPVGSSFAYGALLGLIGVIIVICQKPGLPPAPSGMRAVACPRCNALQNIPVEDTSFECWQCKYVARERSAARAPVRQELASDKPTASGKSTKVRCHHCQHVQMVPVSLSTFVCEQCNTTLKRRTSPAEPS